MWMTREGHWELHGGEVGPLGVGGFPSTLAVHKGSHEPPVGY